MSQKNVCAGHICQRSRNAGSAVAEAGWEGVNHGKQKPYSVQRSTRVLHDPPAAVGNSTLNQAGQALLLRAEVHHQDRSWCSEVVDEL